MMLYSKDQSQGCNPSTGEVHKEALQKKGRKEYKIMDISLNKTLIEQQAHNA